MRFPVITVFFSLICLILQDDRTVICKQECLRFYVIASSAVCLVFTRFLDLSARAGEAALLVFKQYDNCNIHHCFFFVVVRHLFLVNRPRSYTNLEGQI